MASPIRPLSSITLYRGFKGTGAYVWSPFVNKLEARFRFGGLSYQPDVGSPREAPRGKIPYIAVSTQNSSSEPPVLLSDSTFIIGNLVENGMLENINEALSPAQKAMDLALRALLEDKLYFYQTRERWIDNYYTMRPHTLSALPYPIQIIVGFLAHRSVSATLYGQGTLRLTSEEIRELKQDTWASINALLVESKSKAKSKDSTFWLLGGTGPSEVDATLFGFITGNLVCAAAPESREIVKSFPIVVEYAQRIHDSFFPDFVLWK